jgi:hypothetical protein
VAKAKAGKKIKIKVERSSKNMMDPLFAEEWASFAPKRLAPKKDLFFSFLMHAETSACCCGVLFFSLDD